MAPDVLNLSVDLYKAASATVDSLWGIYAGAALALLGYIIGSKQPVPGRAKLGLAAVFLVFAVANAGSLWRAQSIGYAASLSVSDAYQHTYLPDPTKKMLEHLTMSPPYYVVGFQGLLTLSALVAIYAAHRHDTWVKTHH